MTMIGIPLSPGTTFLVPQDLYHTTEAQTRGYAPALCSPPLCWGARGSAPQPVAASLGRHRSEGSGDFWGAILQHLLAIEGQGEPERRSPQLRPPAPGPQLA